MAVPVDLTARRAASARRPHRGPRRLYAVPAPTSAATPRPATVFGDPVADVHAYNQALARYALTAAPMGV